VFFFIHFSEPNTRLNNIIGGTIITGNMTAKRMLPKKAISIDMTYKQGITASLLYRYLILVLLNSSSVINFFLFFIIYVHNSTNNMSFISAVKPKTLLIVGSCTEVGQE
jgi:hypothetical protein